MSEEPDDDDHPRHVDLLRLLDRLDFPRRYYAYCSAHQKRGPKIPLSLQTPALAATGRTFRYDKREKFFAWRDSKAPKGCVLGLNVSLELAAVEWVLTFKTPEGHVGSTLPYLAMETKRLADPAYKHDPPYPVPSVENADELATVLDEGFAIYQLIADAIGSVIWT